MSAVAIVSVGVSGAVAIAAILVGVWQQRRLFEHERHLADRAAVQEVLSDAASSLHRAEYAIDDAGLKLIEWGAAMFENEERAAPFGRLRDQGRELDAVVGQLRIKLGPEHPATLRFDHADAAYLDAYRALDMIRMEDPAITGTYAEQEVAEFVAEQRRRFQQSRGNFKIAQEQFVALAHSAAGAQLPPTEAD
jgi:hypothetical protein